MGDLTIADLMTRDPVTVTPAASLAEATACMVAHRVSEVPVVDAARRVVGILTEGDLLRRAELATAGPCRLAARPFRVAGSGPPSTSAPIRGAWPRS